MLTPAFTITQDEKFLTIIIKAPYAKISEAEIFIEDCDFKFYAKPYYLRLSLPNPIHEDGQEKANYDSASGHFTIRAAKVNPGEHFDGLDLLTKLLAPTGQTSASGPMIQILDSSDNQTENAEEEDFDWQIEQKPFEDSLLSTDGPKYGFASQKHGILKRLQEELCDIIDLRNADDVSISQRREKRLAQEETAFEEEHYLADLFDNPAIEELLEYQPPWAKEFKKLKKNSSIDNTVVFTEEENKQMMKLPKKEYLLDASECHQAFFGLVDLMFAYAYNHRTTQGENNVESGWTICKLSSTLSWLEVFSNLKDVLICSHRRSLSFPLYRNWKLTTAVFNDVKQLFAIGRKRLLKCLLEIHSMLMDGDSRYVLNDLYITDYCVWIQHASQKQISSLAKNLATLTMEKSEVDFDLDLTEEAGFLALQDGNTIESTTEAMTSLSLNGERKASFQNDVLPYKSGAASGAPSESGTDETKSSGDSGDSYSIKEDSDLDDSELFQYHSAEEDSAPALPE